MKSMGNETDGGKTDGRTSSPNGRTSSPNNMVIDYEGLEGGIEEKASVSVNLDDVDNNDEIFELDKMSEEAISEKK
jgi:hypothetical protein